MKIAFRPPRFHTPLSFQNTFFISVLAALFLVCSVRISNAQTKTLNVLDFGALGDATHLSVATTANSNTIVVQTTNRFTDADVGKIVELFGVGTPTSPTRHQDLIAVINSVQNGTNLSISRIPSSSSNSVYCTVGSQNSSAFQRCVDAAGTNAIIYIPNGTYLFIAPKLFDPTSVVSSEWGQWPSVIVTNGGLRFVGESTNAVLLGNGAWTLKTNYVQRGSLFFLQSPVRPAGSVSFENLTFDGGIQIGKTSNRNFPADTITGEGWDPSHGAILETGSGPLFTSKFFTNCTFVHWRGEILKGVTDATEGNTVMRNCRFYDGNASALNFNTTYDVAECTFDTLDMAMEYWMGYTLGESLFQNNTITNVRTAFALVGALSTNNKPAITFTNNSIAAVSVGIQMSPARNVTIRGNTFSGMSIGIMPNAAGYQGTDHSGDFVIEGNVFTNVSSTFVNAAGVGQSHLENVIIQSNIAYHCSTFVEGYGWGTNVILYSNTVVNGTFGIDGTALDGQLYLDDASNRFPPFSIYDYTGKTNTVTYRRGSRHIIIATKTNSMYFVDDSKPEAIPQGAQLSISNAVSTAITFYLSNTRPSAPQTLRPGDSLNYQWRNSKWQPLSPEPLSPFNLRLVSPTKPSEQTN